MLPSTNLKTLRRTNPATMSTVPMRNRLLVSGRSVRILKIIPKQWQLAFQKLRYLKSFICNDLAVGRNCALHCTRQKFGKLVHYFSNGLPIFRGFQVSTVRLCWPPFSHLFTCRY